ncbi:SH3 domain-containing protein [Thaumasiovibrio subtropicus]|uniref:SH3 domain-containing protein n=1 Tax=Thaumasiovibrio subtropicus TaxID=1891207 RepID=UPI000B35F6EA|nr:SH3 domain-containing protein [Thaumasiovibrio subtropicus]
MPVSIYIAIANHRSEYPDPICFSAGEKLHVGERYEGEEDWDNWFFCRSESGKSGWVPIQIFEQDENSHSRLRSPV